MNLINLELALYKNILTEKIKVIPTEIHSDIETFIFSKSKQIRPTLIFLMAKALNIKITEDILSLAAAVEIIHNATLIHDDIIDNADKRRGKISLNKKIGNNLSVLSGDILLSIATDILSSLKNTKIISIFAYTLQKMCIGEINQNSSVGKVPTFDDYIEKSKNKTACLFEAALNVLSILSDIKEYENIRNFAIKFGLAFQIKDDLINIIQTDHTKPELSDIYNGVYTLPVILLAQNYQNINNFTKDTIIELITQNQDIQNQTIEIINEYTTKAIASLDFIEDNQYKKELIKITQDLSKVK